MLIFANHVFCFVQGTAMHLKKKRKKKQPEKERTKKKRKAEADHYPFFADFMAQE